MRIRSLSAVAALIVTFGVLAGAGAAAQTPEPAEVTGDLQTAAWTPLGVSGAAQVLMVQMKGDPVALAEANAGRKLSKAEKSALKAELKAKQDALKGTIAALGGQVLGDYQLAYNGIKVSMSPLRAALLEANPNVEAVRSIQKMEPDNIRGVPYIGTPAVWQGVSGLHGENIKVAIIDTGLDYTHANFGGPGTTAIYDAANAADTIAPSMAHGWGMRVKGGTDLVGDDYNASAAAGSPALIPHPDPNPLDCNGHGSHVGGSAAGSGVLANGSTYTGSYDASTISGNSWRIAPGVAPKADLYGIRVFGCTGSTDVTVDAIEWAVENDMDVINMSLGSSFGSKDDPSAVASTNAAKAGVIVVTSAGNSGPNQYITGSPGTAEGAIATAAQDVWETTPGATLTVDPTIAGSPFSLINANGYEFTGPITGTIVVLQDNPATTTDEANYIGSADESLGCSPSAYTWNGAAGKIAVAKRGTCARVARAVFGQQAGATAVIMTNNAAGFPPFEGQITGNPDTGEQYLVTIPFLGTSGNQATATTPSGQLLAGGNGKSGTITAAALTNTNFRGFASFSSGGPRTGDSVLKPDVTAPGVSIISTANGTGNGFAIISGTSMASPHNAGAAALVRQAKPGWSAADIKAAIVNTADPSLAASSTTAFRISRGGSGTIQVQKSTMTDVIAYAGGGSKFDVAVSYGFEELKNDFSKTKTIKLENHGSSAATFNVAGAMPQGSPHSVALSSSSVTVPAGGTAEVELTLDVPAATVGSATATALSFREVAGLVTFTPASASDNGNIMLRVPYYLVPRALSEIDAKVAPGSKLAPGQTATINVTNKAGAPIGGNADFFAWGLSDKQEGKALKRSPADVRAIGVQSFAGPDFGLPASVRALGFAVNMWDAWSNPSSVSEMDIYVDVDNDGTDDYIVIGVDQGLVQTGTSNGRYVGTVFSTRSSGFGLDFFADAKTDSSTAVLYTHSGRLCRGDNPATPANDPEPCLSAANPRFTYHAVTFDRDGGVDVVDGTAKFNAWTPSISTGAFETLAPGGSASVDVSIDAAEWAQTPALGLMVVTYDNKNGKDEATLIEAKKK